MVSINKLGLSGELLNNLQMDDFYLQMINDAGLELEYTIDSNTIWLEHYGLPPYELPFYGSFNLIFEVSEILDGDVNQDGASDILDIILMVNHIVGSALLTDIEFQIADINGDSSIDIMDIVLLVNTIIN